MKHQFTLKLIILFIAILGFSNRAKSQQQLVFEYDAAGNQISRTWICINCVAQQPSADQIATLEKSLPSNQQNDSALVKRSLMAFPNPVSEELRVEWSSNQGVSIRSMEVFSLSGTKVFGSNYLPTDQHTTISFSNLPAGGYILRALYSDGKKEVVKLIKQ